MSDITSELLTAVVAASADQKARALKVLRGDMADRTPGPEPYLTLKGLGSQLQFHPSTLWRWQVPKHELGGRPRFLASEVIAYLNSDEFKLRADALRRSRRPPPPEDPAERDRVRRTHRSPS